jgi:DNA modification methylase
MPESVTDRPISATEMVFLLAKAPTYYYDRDAVAEPAKRGYAGSTFTEGKTGVNGLGRVSDLPREESATRNLRNFWLLGPEPYAEAHFATFPTEIPRRAILAGCPPDGVVLDPFCGSGTTVMVALRHDRRAIGIELSPRYCDLARRRIVGDAPLFNSMFNTEEAADGCPG